MPLTRRAFLSLPLLIGATGAQPTPIYIDPAGAAGCVNAWRQHVEPAAWDDGLAADALAWALDMARNGARHAFEAPHAFQAPPPRTRLFVGECVAAGQQSWAEAFTAWTTSPGHLGIIQHAPFTRFGLAGAELPGSRHRWYWCYRAMGWDNA